MRWVRYATFPFFKFVTAFDFTAYQNEKLASVGQEGFEYKPMSFDTPLPEPIQGISYDGKLQAQSRYSIETIPSSYSGLVDSVGFPHSDPSSLRLSASPPHPESS